MQYYTLLTLLPALALALPQDPTITAAPSGIPYDGDDLGCVTATGAAGVSCVLAGEGFNAAAAGYFGSVEADPVLSRIVDEVLDQPAIFGPLSAAEQSIEAAQSTASAIDDSFIEGLLVTVVAQHLSEVSSRSERDVVSSVFAQIQVLQGGASATAPTSTGGIVVATGSPSAVSGSAGKTAGTTGSAGATGAAASAAVTSPSKAAAPRQTGLGVMAGVMVGMVGMAVAL